MLCVLSVIFPLRLVLIYNHFVSERTTCIDRTFAYIMYSLQPLTWLYKWEMNANGDFSHWRKTYKLSVFPHSNWTQAAQCTKLNEYIRTMKKKCSAWINNGSRAPTITRVVCKNVPMMMMTMKKKKWKQKKDNKKKSRKLFAAHQWHRCLPHHCVNHMHMPYQNVDHAPCCIYSTSRNYYTIQSFYGLYSPTQWLTRYRTDRFPYAVASQHICVWLYSCALEYEYKCPKYNEVFIVRSARYEIFHFLGQAQIREDIYTCWPGLLSNNHIHIVWHERQWIIIISLESTHGTMCVRRMRMPSIWIYYVLMEHIFRSGRRI